MFSGSLAMPSHHGSNYKLVKNLKKNLILILVILAVKMDGSK